LTHSDIDLEQEIIQTLTEQRVAAVLLTGATRPNKDSDERIARYAQALASVQAKLILCAHPHVPTLPDIKAVNCDNPGGVRLLVQHLVAKGHRRIAFLGWSDTTAANQRFLGYSLGLRDAKLPLEASLVIECADDVVGGHLAALLLLKKPDPPTAIVALNDAVAVGVYRAARDISISIPKDLAVTGFGDSPFATDLTPPLTSIRVPYYEIGRRAAQVAFDPDFTESRVELPTDLIVRDSTG
jgi:LacI family transcriptional regulator